MSWFYKKPIELPPIKPIKAEPPPPVFKIEPDVNSDGSTGWKLMRGHYDYTMSMWAPPYWVYRQIAFNTDLSVIEKAKADMEGPRS